MYYLDGNIKIRFLLPVFLGKLLFYSSEHDSMWRCTICFKGYIPRFKISPPGLFYSFFSTLRQDRPVICHYNRHQIDIQLQKHYYSSELLLPLLFSSKALSPSLTSSISEEYPCLTISICFSVSFRAKSRSSCASLLYRK